MINHGQIYGQNYSGSVSVTNSYYIQGSTNVSEIGISKTENELKTYATTLGDAFIADTNNRNNGYPILAWESNR